MLAIVQVLRKDLRVNLSNRYLRSLVLIVVLKLLASVWIYGLQTAFNSGVFTTVWVTREIGAGRLTPGAPKWPFLFQGWDSIFFVFIARSGYSFPFYAFFPALPVLIKGFGYVLGDTWAASALIAFLVGVAWVPVFQKLAEQYLLEQDAFEATVLAALFPWVFVFTTIAYTEGLFIMGTVSAWYLHLRGRNVLAGLLAALATLTRPVGILILLPMLVKKLEIRKVTSRVAVEVDVRFHPSYLIPAAAALGWWVYTWLNSGTWSIIINSEGNWARQQDKAVGLWLWQVISLRPVSPIPLDQIVPGVLLFSISFPLFILLLASKVWRLDRSLAVYSWLLFFLLWFLGLFMSVPRLVSFIFPSWLALRTGSRLGLTVVAATFLVVSILIWFLFLNNYFVG
jgi:Gpi18-like mannosyltransferase